MPTMLPCPVIQGLVAGPFPAVVPLLESQGLIVDRGRRSGGVGELAGSRIEEDLDESLPAVHPLFLDVKRRVMERLVLTAHELGGILRELVALLLVPVERDDVIRDVGDGSGSPHVLLVGPSPLALAFSGVCHQVDMHGELVLEVGELLDDGLLPGVVVHPAQPRQVVDDDMLDAVASDGVAEGPHAILFPGVDQEPGEKAMPEIVQPLVRVMSVPSGRLSHHLGQEPLRDHLV